MLLHVVNMELWVPTSQTSWTVRSHENDTRAPNNSTIRQKKTLFDHISIGALGDYIGHRKGESRFIHACISCPAPTKVVRFQGAPYWPLKSASADSS